jgi:hypothetical protein
MRRAHLIAGSLFALSATLLLSAGSISASGSADQSFERILARSNGTAPPPYRAFRRMEGGLVNSEKRGWLEVWTQYQPGRGFTFEIVREGGSEYVRNKILRGMLNSEQELIAHGKRLRASFEAKNYVFEDGGAADGGLRRIVLVPAKKSDGILRGHVMIDSESGLITSLQGRLVKSPSFWLRDVDVTWKFVHIGGYALPVEMTSTGRVRMFGRSNFKMTYDYVSVDGQSTPLKAALQETGSKSQ